MLCGHGRNVFKIKILIDPSVSFFSFQDMLCGHGCNVFKIKILNWSISFFLWLSRYGAWLYDLLWPELVGSWCQIIGFDVAYCISPTVVLHWRTHFSLCYSMTYSDGTKYKNTNSISFYYLWGIIKSYRFGCIHINCFVRYY